MGCPIAPAPPPPRSPDRLLAETRNVAWQFSSEKSSFGGPNIVTVSGEKLQDKIMIHKLMWRDSITPPVNDFGCLLK